MRSLLIILFSTAFFFTAGHLFYAGSDKQYLNRTFIQTPEYQDEFEMVPILSANKFKEILSIYFMGLKSGQELNKMPDYYPEDRKTHSSFVGDIISYSIESKQEHIVIETIYTSKESLDEFISWTTRILNLYASEQFEPIRKKNEHDSIMLQNEIASLKAANAAFREGYGNLINEKQDNRPKKQGNLNNNPLSKAVSIASATRFISEVALIEGKIKSLNRKVDILQEEMQLRPASVIESISYADPRFPNRAKIYVLSITGGFIFGIFLVFLIKYIRK